MFDIGAALIFVVADYDRKILLGPAEAVEPVKLGGHQFRRLLDPRRVLERKYA